MNEAVGGIVNPKILIVEDELIIAEDLKKTLEGFGYEIIGIAISSEIAIEIVSRVTPDLMLVDIRIKGKADGIETAEIIKRTKDIPVIFLTSSSDNATVSRAKMVGPYGFLLKPFNRRELYSTIETALYKHTMETRLNESESRLRLITENVNDVIWTMNLEGKFTYISPSVKNLLGYSTEEALSLTIDKMLTPEGLQNALEIMKKNFEELERTKKFLAGINTLEEVRKDGSTVWVELKTNGLYDNIGNCNGIIGVSREITDRIKMEEALKNLASSFSSLYEKELFDKITEHLCESIKVDIAFIGEYVDDERKVKVLGGNWDGKIIEKMEYEIEGSPCQTVIGKNLAFYPDNVANLFPQDQILTDENISSYCGIPLFDKENKPLGIIVLLARKKIEEVELAKSMLQIYSERVSLEIQRKRILDQLRKSEEKFRTVADLTYDWEFWIDKSGRLIFTSPSCERITGYTREEFLLDNDLINKIIYAEDLHYWQNHNEVNPEIEKEELDVRIVSKNGEIKWINHVCYTLLDNKGEFIGRRASNRDITERKKIENAIIVQRDVNVKLISVINFEEALKVIFKYAVKIEGIDCGGVYLLNENKDLKLAGSFGLTRNFEKLVGTYTKNTRQYKLVMQGNPIYIQLKDILGKNFKGKNKKYIKITASIPFKEKNSVIGTLNLASTIVDEFSERQKQVLETFAFQVGSYLSRYIAEKDLRASEEKYRTFFENDLTADFKTTIDGKIIDCNPAFVRMFGFSSKEEALRTPIIKLYKNKNARAKIIEKLKTGKKLELIENKLVTTKGNEILVLENIFGEFNHNNKLIGTVGYLLDITQIRTAEVALRESEKKFRDLFESMQDGFALHEIILNKKKRPINYRFLALNPAFERITGIKASNVLGKTVLDVFPNTEKSWIESYGKVALTGKPIRLSSFSKELGKYFKVLAYSPEKMKFATIVEDITDAKITEQKIRQLSTAIEQSPVSVIITDLKGNIEYVNEKFVELTGYSKEETVGQNPRILKSGTTPATEYKKMWNTIKAGKEWNGIFFNKKKNGELFWESANISPIRNSEGKITHYVAIKEDITERVKVRNELEMHRNRLEELVRLRTKELDETNRKLEKEIQKEKEFEMMLRKSLEKEKELSELKSRFISTTSHEFRTPLTSVLSSAELIQRYSKKWSEEKLNYHTAKIKNSIEYLTKLLDDVLTISRSESGRIIFDPIKTDVKLLCEELIEESKTIYNDKHDLNFVFNPKISEYIVDPKLIRFIITNLLSNAFKYSPNGGKVELKVHTSNGNILFNVSDEGIGIPVGEIKYLFEPFHRANNTIEIPGTGLGLSIVKRAVDLHHGQIKVKSKLGKGSNFTVILPIKTCEACR